jgi:hypothetical protein
MRPTYISNLYAHRLRRPDVPGFWPSNGLVLISLIDIVK